MMMSEQAGSWGSGQVAGPRTEWRTMMPGVSRETVQPDRLTYYVRRERFRPCENGIAVATCYHVPRCGPMQAGQHPRAPFGRWVAGWTRVTGIRQAGREAGAWRSAGWAAAIYRTCPEVRAAVRAWERAAKGSPGEVPAVGAVTWCAARPSGVVEHGLSFAAAGAPGLVVVPCPAHDTPGHLWAGKFSESSS
jgi:hypothetical protein